MTIFASGGLDEDELTEMHASRRPIDGFGVGTSLTTSSDAPALDCAYKLEEYAGVARRKRSAGKATWPGRKQVWRSFGDDGRMAGDVLALQDDRQAGEPLLIPVMRNGQRLGAAPTLEDIRRKAAHGLAQLPEPQRRLSEGTTRFPVTVAPGLIALAEEVDRRTAARDVAE